ncbi:MAG: hypothetical protein JO034_04575 [Singulisphaera sp.]|nr:hypothetical protein [Singulisphaera sp.]
MATTNTNGLEAHLQRALQAAGRLFLALEEIEAGSGLASALAGRRPQSRDEVLARLRSARDQLAAVLGRVAPPPPARPAGCSCGGGRTGRPRPAPLTAPDARRRARGGPAGVSGVSCRGVGWRPRAAPGGPPGWAPALAPTLLQSRVARTVKTRPEDLEDSPCQWTRTLTKLLNSNCYESGLLTAGWFPPGSPSDPGPIRAS